MCTVMMVLLVRMVCFSHNGCVAMWVCYVAVDVVAVVVVIR